LGTVSIVTAERNTEGTPRDDPAAELAAARAEPGWPPADEVFTVDELAERSGMTVRNIRAHQSRRLLHSPRRVGRRSVYDNSHVERLMLIRRLQVGGFSLSAIRALVRAGNEAGELALAWRAEAVAMRFLPGDEFDDAKLEIEPDSWRSPRWPRPWHRRWSARSRSTSPTATPAAGRGCWRTTRC